MAHFQVTNASLFTLKSELQCHGQWKEHISRITHAHLVTLYVFPLTMLVISQIPDSYVLNSDF